MKLIFKSFFDFGYMKNFIKNSKGTGSSLLLMLALVFVLVFIACKPAKMKEFSSEKIKEAILLSFENFPQLIVIDGELQWEASEDGSVQKFDFGNGEFLTIDASDEDPSITEIKSSDVYLTKHSIFFNSNNKVESISLNDLQKFIGKNPMDITSEEVVDVLLNVVIGIIWTGFVFVAAFVFFVMWGIFELLSGVTRILASWAKKEIREMDRDMGKRMAVASVLPAIVALTSFKFIFGYPGLFMWFVMIVAVGFVLICKYAKELDDKSGLEQ